MSRSTTCWLCSMQGPRTTRTRARDVSVALAAVSFAMSAFFAAFSAPAFSSETASATVQALVPVQQQPLFDDTQLLALELKAPFQVLIKDRYGKSTYNSGVLSYRAGEHETRIPIEIRTRGKTRRRKDFCAFPPLRLRFGADVAGTLFEGQRTLKLVTHCQDKDSYEQYVLQEYLAYRAYNQLTQRGLRVRLVRVSYVESNGRVRATRYGILLEDWRVAAARNGLGSDAVNGGVNIDKLSIADANRVAVFQYMIGNQDWSVLWPEPDEDCCHNTKPLLAPVGLVVPLPYDFDFAGIVNAPYALAKNGSGNVRMRRYGGLCSTQSELPATLAQFREVREAIYALYRDQPEVIARRRKSALSYLDGFYSVIDDPVQVERRMVRRCKVD
jgi:hypothetical protein